MLTIFLGPDEFTKKQKLQELAEQEKAQLVFVIEPEVLPIGQLVGQDLFAAKKVFALSGCIKLLSEDNLHQLIESNNPIIFLEEKIDKRSTFNKNLLSNKQVIVEQFVLPHGKELNDWIVKRVGDLGANIEPTATEVLAVALGRDSGKETKFGGKVVEVEEVFTLFDADNEIQKLMAFSGGKVITQAMVKALVSEKHEADVLELVNAIGENRRQDMFKLMERFMRTDTASDEKAKIIQLNALLSEQFRNVAAVQDFIARQVSENEILEKTEWKSGRLFVMKKLAGKFSPPKVLDLLNKLNLLDEELKTTQTPPRVLLDLIFSQL